MMEGPSFCEQKEAKKLCESDAWGKATLLPPVITDIAEFFYGLEEFGTGVATRTW